MAVFEETKSPRGRRTSSTMKGILIGLILLVLVPFLLSHAYFFYNRYEHRRGDALEANLEVARAVAKSFETFVQDVLHSELMVGLALTSSQPITDSYRTLLLDRFKADHPAVPNIFWLSPQGRLVAANTTGRIAIGVDVEDRTYFQEIIAGRDWSVSELIKHKTTGKSGFTINRAIRNEQGELLGIVSASIMPEQLDNALGIDRLHGGTVSLVDNKGMMVYRYPHMDLTLEERNWIKRFPIFKEALRGREVSNTFHSSWESGSRIGSLTPVSSIGWVAGAGNNEEAVLEPIISDLLKETGLLLLIVLTSFAAAFALSRKLSASIGALREKALLLARGEYDSRADVSGPEELRDLAMVFNLMAEKIVARETERAEHLLRIEAELSARAQAEDALRDSEERFRSFMNNNPSLAWIKDEQGRHVYLNKSYQDRFGVRLEEWQGKTDFEVWPAETAEQFRESDQAVLDRGCPIEVATETVNPDGTRCTWWTFKFPFQDSSGKQYIGGIGIDLTERRQMEEQLRELSQRLSYHVGNSPLAVIEWGPDMRLIRWSGAAERIFGWHADEVIGKHMEDFRWIYEEDEAQVAEISFGLQSGARPRSFSANRNYRKDGSVACCEWYNSALLDDSGNLRSILSLVLDVTERKRIEEELRSAQEELELRVQERTAELEDANQALVAEIVERKRVETALRESEQRFREVLDNSLDVPYRRNLITDAYDYLSPRLLALSGYRPEEMLAMPVEQVVSLIHPDDRPQVVDWLNEIMEGGKERDLLEYRFRHKDGSYRWFSDHVAIVRDGSGKPLYGVGNVHDVTERKNAEKVLRDSERELRTLSSRLLTVLEEERKRIAGELHDSIGASLSAIKMSLENLLGAIGENSEPAKSIVSLISVTQQTIDESRRIITALRPSMLDDLGLVTTIGSFCKSFQRVHPDIFIEQVIDVEEQDIPEDLKIVIYRILQEAFHNIAKYSQAEYVELSLEKREGALELTVEDNGEGFDLLKVLHGERQRKGLGLTSMRERAELTGGVFFIESTPEEGTRIRTSWSIGTKPIQRTGGAPILPAV